MVGLQLNSSELGSYAIAYCCVFLLFLLFFGLSERKKMAQYVTVYTKLLNIVITKYTDTTSFLLVYM